MDGFIGELWEWVVGYSCPWCDTRCFGWKPVHNCKAMAGMDTDARLKFLADRVYEATCDMPADKDMHKLMESLKIMRSGGSRPCGQ